MTEIPPEDPEELDLPDRDDDGREFPEEFTYFIGECTCDHEMEDHGWGKCDYDGCPCEAGWEE